MGDIQTEIPAGGLPADGAKAGLTLLSVADIHPHPEQPRRHFDEAALNELADSLRDRGLIQPILVRPRGAGGWEIVAGERRWRAAQRAGLHQIPAIIRDLDDSETYTIALIENIQRKDLNAIEEADAYARLRDKLGHSADAIGRMIGKSRSHITNILRLLELPMPVREMIADGQLGMGHARALIGHDDAHALAKKAVAKGYSVRKVEALVRATRKATSPGRPKAIVARDADIAALESHLADMIGIRVQIAHTSDMSGTLSLEYANLEQLDMLCQRLSGEKI
ncbi:MAG: ParB/RepB/Spo0J family partition protein [Sphingopyxis sp.]